MKEKPKYNVLQNTLWSLGRAWRTDKRVPALVVLCIVFEGGRNLAELYAGPQILARVESGASVGALLQTILLFTGLLFVCAGLLQYINEASALKFSTVTRKVFETFLEKQCATAYPNTLDASTTRLRERAAVSVNYDSRSGMHRLYYSIEQLCVMLLSFGTALALIAQISFVLVLVCLAAAIVNYFALHRADAWRYQRRDEEGRYKSRLNYVDRKAESITLAKEVRIFGLAKWLEDVHAAALQAYEDFVTRAKMRELAADLVTVVMTVGGNGVAYAYLGACALRGELSAAEFLLYFTAVNRFGVWLSELMNGLIAIHRQSLDLSALREYLELPEPFCFDGGAPVPAAEGCELRLEDVSYRYPQAESDILTHVDLTVRAGEKLAVVGLNGAGKTTLVRLLAGLLDPTEGRVLLNGRDIREFNRRDYYALFSAVFQDFSIPNVTVAENVAQCPDEEADKARVRRCLALAGLEEKISTLPKGLDTPVGREVYEDGALFSGGETQRLILARALYKDGPILLLDEPTAALDPLAEDDIYKKYHSMTKGKTALFVSHRLASTRFCDRILFIADGGIAEAGTHEELLKRSGRYKELFDIQSRYYKEGVEF